MQINTPRIVGQVLANNFGSQSSKDGTFSITHDLAGDRLTLKYMTVVHFASERSLQPQVAEANRQALSLIDDKLAAIKDAFKKVTGATLKTTDVGGSDNIELIQPQGLRKIAYYRYNHVFELED
jgi:hypothetical protein